MMNGLRVNQVSRQLIPLVFAVPVITEAITAYGAGASASAWLPPTTFVLVGLVYFYVGRIGRAMELGVDRETNTPFTVTEIGAIVLWCTLGLWYRSIGWESFYVDTHFGIAAVFVAAIVVVALVERVRSSSSV